MKEPTEASAEELGLSDALKFLVGFAQIDLAQMRAGDRLNLAEDLRRYLNVEGQGTIDRTLRRAVGNAALLKPAVEVARKLLEVVADHKEADFPFKRGKYRLDASDEKQPPARWTDTRLEDAILHDAVADLDSEEARRIRRCRRCNRVFYGQLNQLFCSRRCAGAAAVTRYRAKKAGRRRVRLSEPPQEKA